MARKLALRLGRAAAGAVLIALSLNGVAQAVTDTVFKYKTPKTGWFELSASAFTPGNTAGITGSFNISDESLSGDSTCFFAGVNLPHAAKITAVTVWYSADAAQAVGLALSRTNVATGATGQIAVAESTNAGQVRKLVTAAVPAIAAATVNNQQFVYAARVCLDTANARFYSARINYTYATAGD